MLLTFCWNLKELWVLSIDVYHIRNNNNPVYETAKETLMYRSVLWTLGEGEGGEIWENSFETCIISCMKRVSSPGSMHDTGCLGLGHWDNPEGMVQGGRRVQDGEHV